MSINLESENLSKLCKNPGWGQLRHTQTCTCLVPAASHLLCLNSWGQGGAAPQTPEPANAGQVVALCAKELLGFILRSEGE